MHNYNNHYIKNTLKIEFEISIEIRSGSKKNMINVFNNLKIKDLNY